MCKGMWVHSVQTPLHTPSHAIIDEGPVAPKIPGKGANKAGDGDKARTRTHTHIPGKGANKAGDGDKARTRTHTHIPGKGALLFLCLFLCLFLFFFLLLFLLL